MSDLDERERARDRRGRGERSSRGGGDSGRDRSLDRARSLDRGRSLDRARSLDRGNERDGRKASTSRVFVSNISYDVRWQHMKDLFRSQVGDVAFVELFVDDNDRPKGCGIVEFTDPASVKKCMEVMHRFELRGRKLVIKEDFGNARDKYGNVMTGKRGGGGAGGSHGGAGAGGAGGRGDRERRSDLDWDDRDRRGGGGGASIGMAGMSHRDNVPPSLLSSVVGPPDTVSTDKWDNTYGLSPQFLKSLSICKPLVNRVFVANLDYKVDEKKLREVFRLCGRVIDVELYHDREGKSKGFAVIEFDHPVESVQAISMLNGQILYDRPMTVRMDRVEHGDVPVRLPEGLKNIGMGLGMNGEPLRDVSRNLPSSGAAGAAAGAGILGAVPAAASLQGFAGNLGSALTNVVNNPALASLAASSTGLQGVQTPFINNDIGGLVGLNSSGLSAASLVNNSLQSQALGSLAQQSAGLGSQSGLAYGGGVGSGSGGGGGGRGDGMYQGGGDGRKYSSSGTMRDYDRDGGVMRDYDREGVSMRDYDRDVGSMRPYKNDADDYRSSSMYNTINNGGQGRSGAKLTDIVHITNLPITATPLMLREKCNAYGDVQYVEIKSKDSAIVQFANDWQAECAAKMMDQCRLDGRTIDVRLLY